MNDLPAPLLGGRYEIREPIGHGGMADVYRAHDRILHRDVAIKRLRHVTDVDRDRFASEARLLAQLSHESIVTLYDVSVDDGQPWLALELVDGRSMSALLQEGPVAPQALAAVAEQVAAGLAHAHDHGVVHRDVKPGNIMVAADGRARLTDFGIARLIGSQSQHTLTGHVIGTAAYIAPEQVRGEEVTGAADVYAFGLLLLEALTGHRSFPGPATEAALARLHHGPLIPTSLAPGWSGLLAAMTALDPHERPSASATALRLHELAAGSQVVRAAPDATTVLPIVPVVRPFVTTSPATSARRGSRLLVTALGLAVALTIVLTLFARGSSTGAPPASVSTGVSQASPGPTSTSPSPRPTTQPSPSAASSGSAPVRAAGQASTPRPASGPVDKPHATGKGHPKAKAKSASKAKAKSKSTGKSKGKKR